MLTVKRSELVAEIERARSAFLTLLRSLDADERVTPIGEGRWSPLHYLEHLVRAEEATLWRMFTAVDDHRLRGDVLTSPTPEASIEDIVDRTWGEQVDAPPLAVPQLGGSARYWLERMVGNAALVRAFVEHVRDHELDHLAYLHPISGPFTMRQGLQFVRFHIDRHRGHLEAAGLSIQPAEKSEPR